MLDHAKKYEEKLRQLFFDVDFNLLYKYSDLSVCRKTFKLPEDTWESNHFVSVYNGIGLEPNILGMIEYSISRVNNAVTSLYIIRFDGNGKKDPYAYFFGKDIMTAIKDIFDKYNFNKINFVVVIGNPIEKTYDRLIKRYNGRIVGIRKQDIRLIDNKLYDVKEYEIMADDYFLSQSKRGISNGKN
jgi:hypothetical protein